MEILNKNQIIKYLNIPDIPKKEWDGKKYFKNGVATIRLITNEIAYAVCCLDKESNTPYIKKTFSGIPFVGIETIFVVPDYMALAEDVDEMDLDAESKKNAKYILEEAELIESGKDAEINDENELDSLPEWIFPEITNKDEAEAWIRQYNKNNHIKGVVPKLEETIKLRLYNIYKQIK